MNSEIWQRLLVLESRDAVDHSYFKIHARQLNARRSNEISAAARQGREFFRNAANADFSVKPLLSFYGIASLSRTLTLILKPDGGEEGLSQGHGLETVEWTKTLSGPTSTSLSALGELRVRTCNGLFMDLARQTQNRLCFHVRSSAVDWQICYDMLPAGHEIKLLDIFERLPDLKSKAPGLEIKSRYARVIDMSYNYQSGLLVNVDKNDLSTFGNYYKNRGYSFENLEGTAHISAPAELVEEEFPQFTHAYVHKSFGSIPQLYIADPYEGGIRHSQIVTTYLISFFIGMLCRYFPTHWISLIQGGKGDAYWPVINKAQHYAEQTFPELVSEVLQDIIDHGLMTN